MARFTNWKASWGLSTIWIFCLAALAVAAKNFELGGLGVDGPHYALVAREAARSGDWLFLRGTVPEFVPVSHYPHLGIWLLASVFKVFPPADWSARLVGIGFYIAFLLLFFRFLKKAASLTTAVWAVLILWTFDRFSNFFSNVYLDPALLFFGSSALFFLWEGLSTSRRSLCALAGICLAFAAMTKGVVVAGFGPAIAWIAWLALRDAKNRLETAERFTFFLSSAALSFAAYCVLLHLNVPGVIGAYWANQWTHRFSKVFDWGRVISWRFWGSLLRDSHYLLLVPLACLFWKRPRGVHWVPWICLASFALLYAPVDRVGVQYWVLLLPWVAWAFADAVSPWAPCRPETAMKFTGALSLVLVCVLQLAPIRVHGHLDPELPHLQARVASGEIDQVILDMTPEALDFTRKDHYYWYADRPVATVEYKDPVPVAKPGGLYILHSPRADRLAALRRAGWCPDAFFPHRVLLLPCP